MSPTLSAPPPARKNKKRPSQPADDYVFSGHQTFPLRISWLPKAAKSVLQGENPFADPRYGTQLLGIGKNMVEALACWVQFFGIIRLDERTKAQTLTELGELIFGPKGHDPYLEDEQTLWLLHWQTSAGHGRRLFAWHWVTNLHRELEFSRSDALRAFKANGEGALRPLSDVTLRQHLDVFLGTYVRSGAAGQGATVAEDLLESPLASLGLIQEGEPRPGARGGDPTYVIDGDIKNGISNELFRYCLHDWWGRRVSKESTCSYGEICHDDNSPGRVFRLQEREVHARLLQLVEQWPKEFSFSESNNQRLVQRLAPIPRLTTLLQGVYQRKS